MKFVSPFDPLTFWAQGPWMFFNIGVRFMQTWQDECFSRLRLTSELPKMAPKTVPVVRPPVAAGSEIQQLNAEIAARQGRETPLLGCLQGVQVVGGPAPVDEVRSPAVPVAKPAVAKAVVAKASKVAAVKAPAAKAAKAPEATKPAVAKKAMPPVVEAAPVPEVVAVPEVAPAPAASSVTSMLAMQAKSLAKAVHSSPRQPAAPAKSAAKAAAKPAGKAKPAGSKKA